ncbi:MAG: hypothetical protein HY608_08315 [Planctomycetes bacterium]|nr:hypothetical protein [Planctomycetota bacterium]
MKDQGRTGCPSPSALAEWALGGDPDSASRAHVDNCAPCREDLCGLREASDALVAWREGVAARRAPAWVAIERGLRTRSLRRWLLPRAVAASLLLPAGVGIFVLAMSVLGTVSQAKADVAAMGGALGEATCCRVRGTQTDRLWSRTADSDAEAGDFMEVDTGQVDIEHAFALGPDGGERFLNCRAALAGEPTVLEGYDGRESWMWDSSVPSLHVSREVPAEIPVPVEGLFDVYELPDLLGKLTRGGYKVVRQSGGILMRGNQMLPCIRMTWSGTHPILGMTPERIVLNGLVGLPSLEVNVWMDPVTRLPLRAERIVCVRFEDAGRTLEFTRQVADYEYEALPDAFFGYRCHVPETHWPEGG